MQGFWNSILDTGTINNGIDILNTLMQVLDSVASGFNKIGEATGTGMLPTLLSGGLATVIGSALATNIKDVKNSLGEDGKGLFAGVGTGIKETFKDLKTLGLNEGVGSYWQAFKAGAADANGEIVDLGAGLKNVWANMTGVSKAVLGLSAAALAIGTIVKIFDKLTTSAQETKDAVEKATDSYKKQMSEQKEVRSTIDSIGSEWQKLSAGVDSSGNNISLTNDEFERYHEICNQIAGIMPSVIKGYDSQGNAILDLKGNIAELNAEYEKTTQLQAQQRFNENFAAYSTDYKNKTEGMIDWSGSFGEIAGGIFNSVKTMFQGGGYSDVYGNQEMVDVLKRLQNMDYSEARKYFDDSRHEDNTAAELAKEINSILGTSSKTTEEEWKSLQANGNIKAAVQAQEETIKEANNNVKQLIQDYITSVTTGNGEYADLDDNVITAVTQALQNSSSDALTELSDNKAKMMAEINSWLSDLEGNTDAQTALTNILGINDNTSIDDIKKMYEEDFKTLSDALGLDEDGVKELKIRLKLDGTQELINQYDQITKQAQKKADEEGQKQISGIVRDYTDQLGHIDITAKRDAVSGEAMNAAGWSNISKSDADSYFAQTLESDGIQFVLTPVTQDGKQILSPEDLNNYLQDEILQGTDSKNLLLGQFDSEDAAKQVNKFTKEFTKASKKFNQSNNNIKNFLNRNNVNTKQEMNLLKQLMDKYDNWSDVMKNWEAESFDVDVNADSLEALDANLDKVEETIGKINDAYSESITSSGMSKESIQNVVDAFSDLDGYNYDKLFESTASGVHLNTTELAKMNAEYEKHEKSKYADKLKEERDAYEGVCRQISEANTLSEKQELIRKRDSITDQIKQTQELMSRYEGLTNAVTKYQQALQNGEEGDTYDSIVSGYENAMDLWNKGLVGTNEFKSFTQMFSADDLSGKPVADYVAAWQAAMPKMERWLSEGGEGVENFLYDIRDLNSEWAVLADDGVTWDLKGLPDMNTLSNALGISQSGIDAIMRKLSDYGFTINFTEETDNLKALAQSAREAHQELAGFGDLNLDDSDLQKVTGDAERLQAMRDFEFSFDFTDADALDKQIKTADDLRQALVGAYGEGSEKVELFDKQLDYIKAKQGEMADMSSLSKSGLGLGLDMEADAETLNDILKKLTEINNFKNISLKFDTTNIESINNDLETLRGKIETLRGADGKVDMNAEGASELMELYSAELNQKSKLTQNSVISDANTSNLKSAAQRDAITYLQEYQKVSAEYQNAVKVNDAFGADTIDLTNLENNVNNVFNKISNAGDEVKDVFKNMNVDISKIDLSNLTNSINGFNGELNEITKADYSGMGGSLTSASINIARSRTDAIEARETLGYNSLNLNVNSVDAIKTQIEMGETLKQTYSDDADAVAAINKQIDYLNQKKSMLDGSSYNLDLNYNDNKDAIDSIVGSLKQMELYKDFTVDFETKNEGKVENQIQSVLKKLSLFKDPTTGRIDFSQNGASQLMDIMQALINKQIELKNNSRAYMNVDTSGMDASHQNAINNVRGLQNSMDELQKAKYMNALNPDFDTSSYEKAVSDAWKKIQSDTENKKLYTDLKIEPDKVEIKDDKVGDEVQEQIQGQLDNVSCEVLVDAGYDVKNIDKLKEDLQFLNDKYKMNIDIDWENQDPKYLSNKIEDLKEGLKELAGEDGVIKIGEEGYAQAKDTILSLIKLKQQAEGNVVLDIDTSQLEGETQTAVEKLQEIMQAYQDLEALKEAQKNGIEINTTDIDNAQEKVSNLVSTFNNEHPTMSASVGLNIKDGDPEKIASALEGITPTMMVNAGVDEQLVKNYKPEDKDADVNYHVNKQEVTTFLNTNIDKKAWVVWHNDTSDLANNRPSTSASGLVLRGNGANVNGTAHVNGTAYASGNWGAEKDETALIGELGAEIKVDSRTGQWSLLGANGAEFADIHKGDIIFNHKQTSELLKNGYVTSNGGRGKALINGTVNKLNSLFKVGGKAYADGSYGGSGGSFGRFYKNKDFYSVDKGSKNDKDKDEFKETIDWIEIAIQRLEDEISKLDTIASSTYKNFSKRNTALKDEFTDVTEEIKLQQKAYDAYMEKANSIGLSADYMDKIKNGRIQIEDITDEDLKNRIDEALDWINKAYEAQSTIVDLNETLGDLVNQNFENVQKQFEYAINEIEHETSMLETQLNIIENKGNFAGQSYYLSLMKNEQEKIDQLVSEYNDLEKAKNDALASGAIEENSEALKEMEAQLNSVEEAWADAHNQMLQYQNDMREMKWSIFEKAIDYISDIKDESEFIQNLLSVNENDLFVKKTGRLSDAGMATGALHAQNYDVNMGLAESYRKQIEELDKEIEKDPTNTILIDKRLEYLQAQRDSIEAANEEKKNIQQLVSDSYDKMLDVLQKLIDKRKEALEAEKNLYDYEKDISDKTTNIANLQKQLTAIQGDNSEETQAKKQQLQSDLKDAQADLEETQYQQWLTDQEKLMDSTFDAYSEFLSSRLDNIDGLLQDFIDYGNSNSDKVNQTITDSTSKVGYEISDGMKSIWNSTDSGIGQILTEYNGNFMSSMSTISEYLLYIFHKMGGMTKEETEAKRLKDEAERKKQEELRRQQEQAKQQQQQQQAQKAQQQAKQPQVGSMINAGNATIYSNSYGGGGGKQYFSGDPVYTIVGENNGYWLVRWHNLSSGYTGWFRKGDVTAMATGGYTGNNEGMAMLHAKERVLSATQTKAFETLVYDFLPKMSDELNRVGNLKANASAIYGKGNTSNIENSIDLTVTLPNVTSGEDFVRALQTDKNVQKIIKSFTIDEAMGKNSLRKFNIK